MSGVIGTPVAAVNTPDTVPTPTTVPTQAYRQQPVYATPSVNANTQQFQKLFASQPAQGGKGGNGITTYIPTGMNTVAAQLAAPVAATRYTTNSGGSGNGGFGSSSPIGNSLTGGLLGSLIGTQAPAPVEDRSTYSAGALGSGMSNSTFGGDHDGNSGTGNGNSAGSNGGGGGGGPGGDRD